MRCSLVLLTALVFGSAHSLCHPEVSAAPTPEPASAAQAPGPRGAPLPPTPARKDVFSVVTGGGAEQRAGDAVCSFDYEPSGSTWIPGVDESKVFHAVLQTETLRLGIGKGGQIYSLRGAFGEAVPPQRVSAPWIDEVWHLVVTDEDLVTPIHKFQNADPGKNWGSAMPLQYFIHQAGVYLEGLTGTKELGAPSEPFYSPVLESHWDPESRTLFIANWAQMARSPNVWKSHVLVLTAYRDLGDGAVEVTQSLTNFGTRDLTYLNAPWGGVRHSSLPQTVLSKPDGSWAKVEGKWGWAGIPKAPFNETGGWVAWTSKETTDSDPALALVFGRETTAAQPWRRAPSQILHGTAGDPATRDYNVVETSSSVRIQPGETLSIRWFLVAGSFEFTRKRAAELAPNASMWMPAFQDNLLLPVWVKAGKPSKTGEGQPDFHLHAVSAPGRAPLFAMEDTRTGEVFITPDPYLLTPTKPAPNPLPVVHPERRLYDNRVVHYQYDSPGALRFLLGYARKEHRSGQDDFFSAEGTKVEIKVPTATSAP